MTLDRELVTRKLLLITADLHPLHQIHEKGADAFLANTIDQAVVATLRFGPDGPPEGGHYDYHGPAEAGHYVLSVPPGRYRGMECSSEAVSHGQQKM